MIEPLAPEEIAAACRVVRGHPDIPDDVRFVYACVHEPRKGDPSAARRADAMAYHRPTRATFRATADLDAGVVVAMERRTDVEPSIIYEEYAIAGEVVKADEQWREALRRRGITDFDLIQVDPWVTGDFGVEWEQGRRCVRALSLVRRYPGDNGYARPIEGVIAWVDLNERRIIKLEDHGVVPIPEDGGEYDAERQRPWREPLRPLDIVQPDGPSFTLDGSALSWDCWRLGVTMHPVDGLVLHDVRWVDGERERSVLKRASIGEMVVPYGDVSPDHGFKHVMDVGEYGFGPFANSLELGCDCLGEIRYLDASFAGPDGDAMTTRNAICIHEEDYGILWKHWDHFSGNSEVRRSRRLVVSSIHTVGNYEYGVFWYLYLDGSIQLEMKLTGIMSTMAIHEGAELAHARRIGRQLAAPHHQHLFCFRLDFDVDGTQNTVVEIDAVPCPPGPDNPFASAFVAQETVVRRESEGMRDADPSRARHWEVRNPNVRNRWGEPVAYRIKPGHGTTRLLADDSSSVTRRAQFAKHNLWVTAYDPAERKAAGDYPNQHAGGDGLPAFVAADRPLENADIVCWLTVGSTHIARPEDWPVMPVEYTGFMLQPAGFFDRNPAMNLPPMHGHHC